MAEETKPSKVSLKLLIDPKSQKVLLAEAGKDFVDFLFHILSLPVATVVKLLSAKGMVGSLGDIYKSIKALNTDYMQPSVSKDSVLKPMITNNNPVVKVPLLPLNDNAPTTTRNTVKSFYGCSNRVSYTTCYQYLSDGVGATCPDCYTQMSERRNYIAPMRGAPGTTSSGSSDTDNGYVKEAVTYMVMDNLEVKPMTTISFVTLLNKFQVKDVASLVEKEVQLGLFEGVALLKASLTTKAVLTTVFLK